MDEADECHKGCATRLKIASLRQNANLVLCQVLEVILGR